MAPHQAPQAILQPHGIEVQQQPHLTAAHPQVGQKLRFMGLHQPFDRLDFDNEIVGDQQVSPEARFNSKARQAS